MSHRVIANRPMHIHPHLEIIKAGKEKRVPSQIGIKPSLWHDHEYDKYMGDMGAAAVHTHDSSGILHVESSVTMNYTLGDFYKIWGQSIPAGSTVTADGKNVAHPNNLVLKDGENIVINEP
jgi:hypothetical protein